MRDELPEDFVEAVIDARVFLQARMELEAYHAAGKEAPDTPILNRVIGCEIAEIQEAHRGRPAHD